MENACLDVGGEMKKKQNHTRVVVGEDAQKFGTKRPNGWNDSEEIQK